jgi:hypothetical protein
MSLLRILRNLAVLVILTVAYLSLLPRPMAAQTSCQPLGTACNSSAQCCNHWCGPYARRCCKPLHGMTCSSWIQCCSGVCINGGCN